MSSVGQYTNPVLPVELRRHHAGRITRWTPRVIGKANGTIAQIVRNNIVGCRHCQEIMMCRWQDCLDDNGLIWLQPLSRSMGGIFFNIVIFTPDFYCSLIWPGAI